MKYLRLSILTLFLAIALASLTSCNSFAVSLDVPVQLINGNFDGRIYAVNGSSSNSDCHYYPSNYSYVQNSCTDQTLLATTFSVEFQHGTYLNTDIVDIPLYFTLNANNNSLDAWLRNLTVSSSDNGHWSIIDVSYENLTTSSALAHVYLKSYGSEHSDWSVTFSSNNNYILALQPSEVMGIGNTVVWRIVDSSAGTSAIVNSITAQSSTLNSIDTGIKRLQDSMDGVAEQEERVADVAEDEYNKTIQDEQTASSGASGFSFNFTLPNPFSIFQVSDGCVSTPTIDSWLHLEGDWKSPHCPIIPANVRNVLTPVVSLIVTLATLLVVIRWVSSSAVDVAGNSVSLNDKPQKGGK